MKKSERKCNCIARQQFLSFTIVHIIVTMLLFSTLTYVLIQTVAEQKKLIAKVEKMSLKYGELNAKQDIHDTATEVLKIVVRQESHESTINQEVKIWYLIKMIENATYKMYDYVGNTDQWWFKQGK